LNKFLGLIFFKRFSVEKNRVGVMIFMKILGLWSDSRMDTVKIILGYGVENFLRKQNVLDINFCRKSLISFGYCEIFGFVLWYFRELGNLLQLTCKGYFFLF
jgi:hypothetical protein